MVFTYVQSMFTNYVQNFFLTVVVLSLFWIFNRTKQIYKKLNKKNRKIPDINVIKKIVHFTPTVGWTVDDVFNGLPIWRYGTTFSFSPYNLYGARSHLTFTTCDKVLEELVDEKVFTSMFPGIPKLQLEQKTDMDNNANQDHLRLSNIYSHLSLASILRNRQSAFSLERFWFSEPKQSWLYICPTTAKLSEDFGYWICFHLQDLPEEGGGGCLLHVLTSFPQSTKFWKIKSIISSCVILTEDHMKFLPQQSLKYLRKPKSKVVEVPEEETRKVIKKKNKEKGQSTGSSSDGSSANQKKPKVRKEGYGVVEEPAIIKRIMSNENIAAGKANERLNKETEVHVLNEEANKQETQVESFQSSLSSEPRKDLTGTTERDGAMISRHISNFVDYVVDKRMKPFLKTLDEAFGDLLKAYEADENTPGWSKLPSRDGVRIYRKDADEISTAPLNRGTSIVRVPFSYLLHYCMELNYKKEYDSMYEKGESVVEFDDGLSKVYRLQFTGIWPVAARDFCSITSIRHLKENVYGICVRRVEHPECPPSSGKVVRGEVILGGFVFKILNAEPPEIEITYMSRADLKGSIPQRFINRLSAEQPMFANTIRKHCERRYKDQDPPHDIGDHFIEKLSRVPSVFEKPPSPKLEAELESIVTLDEGKKKVDDLPNKEILTNGIDDSPRSVDVEILSPVNGHDTETMPDPNEKHKNEDGSLTNGDIIHQDRDNAEGTSTLIREKDIQDNMEKEEDGFIITENHYLRADDDADLSKDNSIDDDLELRSMNHSASFISQVSVYEQELELPRDASGQVDFVTLGNQAAALLEEEYLVAKKKLSEIANLSNGSIANAKSIPDEWVSQGISKNVLMMKKVHSNQKYHSFLGQGLIKVLPITVWEALKNPTTRFVFDNMLKQIHVVKEIADRYRILYMRHETNACFLKQARDFSVLIVERAEQKRYVLAATSVDIPECPPNNDCVRGHVIGTGWLIEPVIRNNRSCTLVTYISQVNFGGRLPTRLVNTIGRRQPLAIAYLRDYLESNEM